MSLENDFRCFGHRYGACGFSHYIGAFFGDCEFDPWGLDLSFDNLQSAFRSVGPEELRAVFLVVKYFCGDTNEAARWFNQKNKQFNAKPISVLRRRPKAFLAWCERNLVPFDLDNPASKN